MRLICIRHGQTTGDVEDRYGGAYDDLLSSLGEDQVRELATELKDAGIEKIFASPLKRAQQTAQGLANEIGCPIVTIDGLRERDQYGAMTGMIKSDAKVQFKDLVEQIKDRLFTAPGAESYVEASMRVSKTFKDVLDQADHCSAIVWHGGCMRVLFRDILKMGELLEIGDCSWVELERSDALSPFFIKQYKRIEFAFKI